MLCYGEPRFGKSTANKYLREKLIENKKMVPLWAAVDPPPKVRVNKNEFWRLFRIAKDDAYAPADYNKSPYRVLLNRTRILAEEYGTERVFIGIDEAQNLNVDRYADLKRFTEELIDLKLSPFVLIMAQPSILVRVADLKKRGHHDIVDRFHTRDFRFRGLRLEEFPAVLQYIDAVRWPGETGPSYTEYFVPRLWKGGWRLAAQAPAFTSAFQSQFRNLSAASGEVGMKFLVVAARLLLTSLEEDESRWANGAESLLRTCVAECGYREFMVSVGGAERAARSTLAARKASHD